LSSEIERPAASPARRGLRAIVALGVALAVLPLFSSRASAQFFGQNKVHYKNFHWRVLRTQHFDIHYYQGTEAAVNDAALFAERAYQRLSRVLNHQIHARVPLVLYASHTDFEQTNITPELLGIGTGGVTEFIKRRVFLPFTGSYAELDHVLTHELVHAFQVDILFGENQGLLGNPFASSIPGWFMEGMAEYLSIGGTDPATAMWLRDAALEGYLIPIRTLEYVGDIRVYRFGQSIWNFIADTYGIEKIGDILKRTRRMGSAEHAIEASTGLSIDVLSKKWTEYIRKQYLPEIATHQSPSQVATKLTDSERDMSNFNVAASVAPDGLQYVFISDKSMYNDVYLASALDGKIFKKLISGERTGSFETLRFFNTSIAWSPNEKQIAIPAKVGGEDALYIVNVPSGKIANKYRFGLDAIYSPSWSPDGNRFTFVGLKNGRSILYLADANGKNLRPLKSGRYAVLDPTWSPDGSQIAYVTDEGEGTDTTRLIFGPLRLAVMDVATGVVRVPHGQTGKNISPQWTPDGASLLFVSDRTGISNIYRMDLATGESVRLTDLLCGVSGLVPEGPCLSVSRDGNRILFTAFTRGGWDVYSVHDPRKLIQSPPAVNAGRTLATTSLAPLGTNLAQVGATDSREIPEQDGLSGTGPMHLAEPADTSRKVTEHVPGGSEGFAEVHGGQSQGGEVPPAPSETSHESQGFSETHPPAAPADTTRRETTLAPGAARPDSAHAEVDTTLADYVRIVYSEPLADSTTFQHLPYRPSFSRDYFAGGAVVASNVGFAGSSVLSFSDLLGNHNILAVLNLYGNIGDSDIYLAYSNLAHRVNYGLAGFQYQEDLLLFTSPSRDDLESQIHRGGSVFFSYPFTRFKRIEWGMEAAVIDQNVFRYDYSQGTVTNVTALGNYLYVAPNISLISDNALYGSTGPIKGGRSRFSVEHAVGGVSYTTGVFDWRAYTNVARRLTIAKRLLGGGSFGQDPQIFRFGGSFTYRGADYGELVGTRAAIGNLEIRFPLIESLRTGFPIQLGLGGINGVLFLDGASAWNGDSDPVFFSNKGGFHTSSARLAYGFGARVNLGYFILRYDYGVEQRFRGGLGPAHHFLTFGPEF